MAIILQGENIRQNRSLEEFETPLGDYLGAKFSQQWNDNIVTGLLADRYDMRGNTEQGIGFYNAETARGIVKESGVKIDVPDDGISEPALNVLIKRQKRTMANQDAINRSPTGGRSVVGFGTSLVAGILDPVNIAAAFVPVVGEARYTQLLANATSAFGRAGVRAAVGAAEGAVGTALLEPATYALHQSFQDDYTMTDSLLNIAFGGVLGGGLHVGGGAIADVVRASRADSLSDSVAALEPRIFMQDNKPLVVYHGTNNSFDQFDSSFLGSSTGAESAKKGFFLTDNKHLANEYSQLDVGYIEDSPQWQNLQDKYYEKYNKLINEKSEIGALNELEKEFNEKFDSLRKKMGSEIKEANLLIENPLVIDAEGNLFTNDFFQPHYEKAIKEGRDAVIVKNAVDGIDGAWKDGAGPSTLYIVFDSKKVSFLDTSAAKNITSRVSTETRTHALKTAVAQSIEGKMVDVEPVMATDPKSGIASDVKTAAERQANPDSVRVADSKASIEADTRLQEAPKSNVLKDAEAELTKAVEDAQDRWASLGRDQKDMKDEFSHLDDMVEQTESLANAARVAALCDMGG